MMTFQNTLQLSRTILKRTFDSPEYKKWRTAVFKRDKYTCRWCKKRKRYLQAHHIKKYADYPRLRFSVSNGISLCLSCHKKVWGKEELYEELFRKILANEEQSP